MSEAEIGHDHVVRATPSIPLPRKPEPPAATAPLGPEPSGEWTQPTPGRLLARIVVALGCLGALTGLVLTAVQASTGSITVLAVSTVVAVMTYGSLTLSDPTTVTLAGPLLTVHRGEMDDVFDLSRSVRRLRTEGRPNRPNWRLLMETVDGRLVELGPDQVDPMVITAALQRYRTR